MIQISDLSEEDLDFYGNQESQSVGEKSEWSDSLIELIENGVQLQGDQMPWEKTKDIVRFRPGELTVWAGVNGHGKSLVTSQVALWLMVHTRVCIASLEMKPVSTLMRMVRQAAGCDNVATSFVEKFMNWRKEELWIYDQTDSIEPERILGVVYYVAKKLHVKHIFIDSLMKCGINTDDYNKQKIFVDRLCWAAKTLNIHIHLVHHVRKGSKEHERPGKFDIKGAGEITDLVDNVILVFRNKSKEEKIEKLKVIGSPANDELIAKPDAILKVEKQRHGEWEGNISLWFHAKSMQFHPRPSSSPMIFNMDD